MCWLDHRHSPTSFNGLCQVHANRKIRQCRRHRGRRGHIICCSSENSAISVYILQPEKRNALKRYMGRRSGQKADFDEKTWNVTKYINFSTVLKWNFDGFYLSTSMLLHFILWFHFKGEYCPFSLAHFPDIVCSSIAYWHLIHKTNDQLLKYANETLQVLLLFKL